MLFLFFSIYMSEIGTIEILRLDVVFDVKEINFDNIFNDSYFMS